MKSVILSFTEQARMQVGSTKSAFWVALRVATWTGKPRPLILIDNYLKLNTGASDYKMNMEWLKTRMLLSGYLERERIIFS